MLSIREIVQSLGKVTNVEDLEKLIKLGGIFGDHKIYAKQFHHLIRNDNKGFFQIPRQLAETIFFIKKYKIESFCNIGTHNGWTVSLIHAFLKTNLCVSLDIVKKTDALLPDLGIDFKIGDSFSVSKEKFDLCYIDGNHSYQWVKNDFMNIGIYSKICVFHDINNKRLPDVARFYNETKKSYHHVEFLNPEKDRNMGVGILKIIKF